MAWFNRLSRFQRAYWLAEANSYVPADAWAAFKRGAR
jgi:inorganic triphosphatase YgiF